VATAEHEATGDGIKPVKGARGKTTNANKIETRAGKRKSPSEEISMTEDSPDRKRLRAEVKEAKMKQADKVNKLRMKNGLKHERKDPLDVGDICTVSTQGLKKVYFPHLPVIITAVSYKGETKRYSVATKQGHIRGTYGRKDLQYRKNYNGHILGFNVEAEGFKRNLSLQETYNEVALNTHCNCKGDCSNYARCSWGAAGTFCTSLRHSGRGKNKQCTLLDDLCCSGSDEDYSE
jgi:hypothetical protein